MTYDMMVQSHVGFWTLGLIVFVLSYILIKAGKAKPAKILHMILRLLYVLIFATGLYLVIQRYGGGDVAWPTVKGLFGLLVISMMEMILIRGKKQGKAATFWVLLIIALIAVFYIGYAVLV